MRKCIAALGAILILSNPAIAQRDTIYRALCGDILAVSLIAEGEMIAAVNLGTSSPHRATLRTPYPPMGMSANRAVGDPPGLVAGEQLGRSAASRLLLEIDVGSAYAFAPSAHRGRSGGCT
jgi:hypothetical protein